METVLRAVAVYALLLVVFRISGKRSLGQVTTFDFVLLLVIAEVTQQALTGEDFSFTTAFILVVTLTALDIGLSLLKQHFPTLDNLIEGEPLILVENGRPIEERMARERVDVEDILATAREKHGLERMEQIRYAILERSGGISIIPRRDVE